MIALAIAVLCIATVTLLGEVLRSRRCYRELRDEHMRCLKFSRGDRTEELKEALATEAAQHKTTKRALERVHDRNRELSARQAYVLKTVQEWGRGAPGALTTCSRRSSGR